MSCAWRRMLLAVALTTVAIAAPSPVLGHADIVERITALSREIAHAPPNAALHLKRGELHRLHRDWPAALADYDQAARLDPANPAERYYRGRMWLEAGRPGQARPLLDRYLALRPNHADALLNRSRALALSGDRLAATDDLTRAIALLDPPTPEVYLERARLLRAEGPAYAERLLAGLDEGIARLGPLVTLIRFAVEVERGQGGYSSALARLDALPEHIAGQPVWLALGGDLLLAAESKRQAHARYAAGIKIIESYSPTRRKRRATVRLETRLRSSLEKTMRGAGQGEDDSRHSHMEPRRGQ